MTLSPSLLAKEANYHFVTGKLPGSFGTIRDRYFGRSDFRPAADR